MTDEQEHDIHYPDEAKCPQCGLWAIVHEIGDVYLCAACGYEVVYSVAKSGGRYGSRFDTGCR